MPTRLARADNGGTTSPLHARPTAAVGQVVPWPRSVPEGRWSGFGPYYAMFPVLFARNTIERYCPPGGSVLDPFCGRGTSLFVAKASNRSAVGVDLNEVGWLYSSVKIDPCPDHNKLLRRLKGIGASVTAEDRMPENDFQRWAWCSDVLGFLHAARRELDWRGCRTDRTLMAFILVYLHAKVGGGLSNQMRQSKAMSPDYSVEWWRRQLMAPPSVNPVEFMSDRIKWRYKNGTSSGTGRARALLGDARDVLKSLRAKKFDLVLTSPPYMGITNYRADQWIRWWMLGGPALPNWGQAERYSNRERYEQMLDEVFALSAKRSKREAIVYVRTDARLDTLRLTAKAIQKAWPQHFLFGRDEAVSRATQTALFGDREQKPGEVDIIACPNAGGAPTDWRLISRPGEVL